MKKVLIFGMTPNPGGVESVIMNYYRNMNRREFEIDFACGPEKIAYEDEILNNGNKVFHLPYWKQHWFKFQKGIKQIFKKNKYDVVWVNLCKLTNISILTWAKKFGVKMRIIHSHNSKDMGTKIGAIFHWWNKKRLKNLATHFWSCSQEASDYFFVKPIQELSTHKVIKNAVNIDKFAFNKQVRDQYRKKLNWENDLVFGHVGRLHFQKNQEVLIKIFVEIKKNKQNSKLVLIGQGEDEEKLKTLVKDLKLTDCVEFLGVRNDVDKLYNAFDLMVFPSLFEGLPVALVEAQVNGLTIFASDVISKETKLVDNYYFYSLQNSPQEWADFVISNYDKDIDRLKNLEELKKSQFNIKTQVENFIDLI